MDFNKDMKAFVLALSKLNNNEFCGVADLLNVSVWTDPLPVRASNSEDAGAINTKNSNDIISFADRHSGTTNITTSYVDSDVVAFNDAHPGVSVSANTNTDSEWFITGTSCAATTTDNVNRNNPFVTANRSQPRDASDIIADICEAFDQLPRSNKRYLLKLVKRAGGH